MAASAEHLESAGLAVRVEASVPAAALRYFSAEGVFAASLRAAGVILPQRGRAVDAGSQLLLAWRSPTETLCLAGSETRLAELRQVAPARRDGYLVELSGALTLVHIAGPRIGELVARLGGSASLPAKAEARRSRIADVPVLALCVSDLAVQLVVDRTYAQHLWGWIRETLLDFV